MRATERCLASSEASPRFDARPAEFFSEAAGAIHPFLRNAAFGTAISGKRRRSIARAGLPLGRIHYSMSFRRCTPKTPKTCPWQPVGLGIAVIAANDFGRLRRRRALGWVRK